MRKEILLLLAVSVLFCGGADGVAAGGVTKEAAVQADAGAPDPRGVFLLRTDGTYALRGSIRADVHGYRVPGTLVIDTDTAVPEDTSLKVAGDLIVKRGAVLSLDGEVSVGGSLIMEEKPDRKPSHFGKGGVTVCGDVDIGAGALKCADGQVLTVEKTGDRHTIRIGRGNCLSKLYIREDYSNITFGNMTEKNKRLVDLGTVRDTVQLRPACDPEEIAVRYGDILPMFQSMDIRSNGGHEASAEKADGIRKIVQRALLDHDLLRCLMQRQEVLPEERAPYMWSKEERLMGRIALKASGDTAGPPKRTDYYGGIQIKKTYVAGQGEGIAYKGRLVFDKLPPLTLIASGMWPPPGTLTYWFEGTFGIGEVRALKDSIEKDLKLNALKRYLVQPVRREWLSVRGENIDRLADAYLYALRSCEMSLLLFGRALSAESSETRD